MVIEPVEERHEVAERIDAFLKLLAHWNRTINLVSHETLRDARARHVIDSLQILTHTAPVGRWVDIGSGGGIPGMVLALAMPPSMSMTLVERDKRKCEFLRTVRRALDVPVTIKNEEVDLSSGYDADVVLARGLAPLGALLGLLQREGSRSPVGLFLKGVTWRDEVRDAMMAWNFKIASIPSQTMAGAAILRVEDVHAK